MTFNFAELKKRLQPRSVLALTLTSTGLSGSVVASENGDWKESHAFTITTGAEVVSKDAEKAGKELAAALDSARIRLRRCVVCVPPGWALTAATDLPEVSSADLQSFLELRAEREFPISAADMRLGYSPYTLPGGKRHATLAAIPAKRLEAVEKMLAAAGCQAVSISLALEECLPAQEPKLHFLANGSHADLVITGGGGVVSMRCLSALGSESAFDAVSFYREMRITLGRLPETIRKQLTRACFTGTPDSAQRLCVETRVPLSQLGIKGIADEALPVSAAVGASKSYLGGSRVAFEFVEPDPGRWQVMFERFNSKRHRLILFAAFGAIVLPLLLFSIRSEMESHYQSKWNGMKKKVTELDALQQKIHRFQPWHKSSPQVLQMIEALVAAFPEQGDVWAKSIAIGENGKVTCNGFAKSREGLFGLMDRLRAKPEVTELQTEQVRGENPVQFAFSFKYSPTP